MESSIHRALPSLVRFPPAVPTPPAVFMPCVSEGRCDTLFSRLSSSNEAKLNSRAYI